MTMTSIEMLSCRGPQELLPTQKRLLTTIEPGILLPCTFFSSDWKCLSDFDLIQPVWDQGKQFPNLLASAFLEKNVFLYGRGESNKNFRDVDSPVVCDAMSKPLHKSSENLWDLDSAWRDEENVTVDGPVAQAVWKWELFLFDASEPLFSKFEKLEF